MEPGTQGLTFVKALDGREGAGCFLPISLLMPAARGWVRLQTLVIGKFGPETQAQRSSTT